MASIDASTSGAGGIITTADNTGTLNLQSGGTTIATVSSTGLSLATGKTLSVGGVTGSPYTMKNRIINGAMLIDQRNAGGSVTPTNNQYILDRWAAEVTQASKFTVQQVSGNANTTQGYQQSLKVTSSSAYSVLSTDVFDIKQQIEGYNIADFAWGTSGAKTVTLSFWVYSSLTGTFGGSITNDGSYSYPFSYTINAANTWEQKSVTITGSTSGTWNSTNGTGLYVRFNLGCGSNYLGTANAWVASNIVAPTGSTSIVGTSGATWYLVGVQLEVGSSATSFEWRPYTTELQLCQRYYQTESSQARFCYMRTATDNWRHIHIDFKVQMRATPTWTASLTAGAASSDYQTNMSADAYRYYANTSTADYVTTWTASAEL